MAILSITNAPTGLVGVVPATAYIETNDTLATISSTGYLTEVVQNNSLQITTSSIVYISTIEEGVGSPSGYIGNVLITGTAPNYQYSFVPTIGELQTKSGTVIPVSSHPSLILSLNLTAGYWLIWGNVELVNTVGSMSLCQAGITNDNTSLPAAPGYTGLVLADAIISDYAMTVPMYPVSLDAPATYYLMADYASSGGTITADAQMFALRIGFNGVVSQ